VNRSIVRLFGVMILLFVVLIAWTSRWTVFDANTLDNNGLNKLAFYESLKVKRGTIYADNGEVLARSVKVNGGTWKREYPTGPLFAQPIGYFLPEEGRKAGLEQARNKELKGLENAFTSVFGSFNGTPTVGDDIYTTLDPKAQELARQLVAASPTHIGSVVAMVPQTGAIKVLFSSPTYNNNNLNKCKPPACSEFFNAVEGGYPPGSTFKLVTTTAALDSKRYTPLSIINGDSPITISGKPLQNDDDDSYGDVTLTKALTDSINTVYAQVGESLGAAVLQKYMDRFGFYSIPPVDYPANQMTASGETFGPGTCGKNKMNLFLQVTNPCVDLGRTAIGQANLTVTPLQMAMVVATIADKGTLMEPRLTTKAVNSDGQVVETVEPQEYDQVMKPKYAAQLTTMMEDVVEEGTGQLANVDHLKVAGKTGTASIPGTKDGQPLDDAWFVGFAVNDPKIAVAVELTGIPNGYGGTYAAPIAAKVIKTLLAEDQ
jgi:penicillin-binding protein A